MNKKIMSVVGLLALGYGIYYLGYSFGKTDGEAYIQRLKVVFTNFDTLPKDDRALLASLSMTCHLARVEVNREKILACLRDGLTSPELKIPEGVAKESVATKLENLIQQAN